MDNSELKKFIQIETDAQKFEEFEHKIMSCHPKKLDDYLRALLDVSGENYGQDLNAISRILSENKIHFSDAEISSKIDAIKKEIKLKNFESTLIDSQAHVSIEQLDNISGHEFEEFLVILFKKMGYIVESTKLSNDQGADLIVSRFGEKIVVQAKRYSYTVGNDAVQEAVAAIKHYGAQKGMVVTTSSFSRPAAKLAISNNIRLIDRSELNQLIAKHF